MVPIPPPRLPPSPHPPLTHQILLPPSHPPPTMHLHFLPLLRPYHLTILTFHHPLIPPVSDPLIHTLSPYVPAHPVSYAGIAHTLLLYRAPRPLFLMSTTLSLPHSIRVSLHHPNPLLLHSPILLFLSLCPTPHLPQCRHQVMMLTMLQLLLPTTSYLLRSLSTILVEGS